MLLVAGTRSAGPHPRTRRPVAARRRRISSHWATQRPTALVHPGRPRRRPGFSKAGAPSAGGVGLPQLRPRCGLLLRAERHVAVPAGFPLMQASERACLVVQQRVARVGALHDDAAGIGRRRTGPAARVAVDQPVRVPQEIPAGTTWRRARDRQTRGNSAAATRTLVLSRRTSMALLAAARPCDRRLRLFPCGLCGGQRPRRLRDRRVYPDADGDTRFETYPVTMHMSHARARASLSGRRPCSLGGL